MYTYRQIFKQSFKAAGEGPGIWFFGLFTALLGNAGGLELIFSSYGFGSEGILFGIFSGFVEGGLFTAAGMQGLISAIFTHPIYIFVSILFLLLVFGISLLILWLSIVSQIGLIGKVVAMAKNKKLEFRDAFRLGLTKFWPILGMNILLRAASLVLFVFIILLASLNFPGSIFIFLFGFLVFLILILIVSFIGKYAICGMVLKNWRFGQALKYAWNLFLQNWWLSLEVAMILFLIYVVSNLLLVYFISWALFLAFKIYSLFFFAVVLTFLFTFVVFTAAQVLLTVFIWGSWAIIFEVLTSKQFVLTSFLHKIFKK